MRAGQHIPLPVWMLGLVAVCCLLGACGAGRSRTHADTTHMPATPSLPDTLIVGTLYGPTSYFIYRDEPMGYNYELISKFAADSGMPMRMEVADNFHELVDMLRAGKVHILAYDIPKTAEYNGQVLHCGPVSENYQVLVQPAGQDAPKISDVTQLPGQKVYVEKDSKYYYRLLNLNREVGGGIDIVPVAKDSVMTEDMIEMVARREIPLTVIDSDIARISRTYYSDIDVSVPVSMAQASSWAVAPGDTLLANAVDRWETKSNATAAGKEIYRRYYELSKQLPAVAEAGSSTEAQGTMLGAGRISRYDDIFRRYAPQIGWDWRLLAAQAYNESRFDVDVVSWAGARGLMQLMPRTAAAMGLPADQITNPDLNVKAAVKAIAALDKMFASKVPDADERRKFIVAAYNSGGAHILDAIVIAGQSGRNPRVWDGNVEQALLLKSNPQYYRLPGVKYGYFKGSQTVEYVKRVMNTYALYKQKIPA